MSEASAYTPINVVRVRDAKPPRATSDGTSPTISTAVTASSGGTYSSVSPNSHISTVAARMPTNSAASCVRPDALPAK